jgi:hypothetical protein
MPNARTRRLPRLGHAHDPLKQGAANGSGLGFGTIQLHVNATGTPEQISWQISAKPIQTPILIVRALQ